MKKVLKKTEYVLKSPLKNKGSIGEIIKIAPGYGRYLERFNIALRATKDIKTKIEASKVEWMAESKNKEVQAEILIDKIKKIEHIKLSKKVAQNIKLYQAIRREDIVEALKDLNIAIKNDHVFINNVIKTIGDHEVVINVYGNFETTLKVVVESNAFVVKK